MSDISITITSDPTQAVTDINKVKKAADDLATTSKKVAESSAADNTQAVNQVLTVSRQAQQAVSQTGTAVSAVSSGIKQAAGDASKVAGAFGSAVPVVGRLGSAIASAITGPIGAISAAIGLAIAGINKMIADAEDRVQRLKMSAGTQANSAYDKLIQGRTQYAEDLKTLEQIKQIQAVAKQSALSASELAQFRQLAAQLGIQERYVGERGIRSGKIAEAERTLNQQRDFYSQQDYRAYVDAFQKSLLVQIGDSNLAAGIKDKLLGMSNADRVNTITQAARLGQGGSVNEYKAWQELYGQVKQYNEVTASFARDARLGRSQADLNAAAVASITGAHSPSARGAADNSSGGSASPGTWAWQQEQDKKAMAAAEAERKEQERRNAAAAGLTEKLQQEIEIQTMINDGRQREADILRQRISLESALGRQLTSAEQASIEQLAGTLYDLRHPQDPDLAPLDPNAPQSAARSRARSQAATVPLDRYQRIGGNVTNPATSPEKFTLDRQLAVQEEIRNMIRSDISTSRQTSGNVFP